MKKFKCRMVETLMHRYIVELKVGRLSILIEPSDIDTGTNNARLIADFINEHIESFSYSVGPEDIAVDLERRPN